MKEGKLITLFIITRQIKCNRFRSVKKARLVILQ